MFPATGHLARCVVHDQPHSEAEGADASEICTDLDDFACVSGFDIRWLATNAILGLTRRHGNENTIRRGGASVSLTEMKTLV